MRGNTTTSRALAYATTPIPLKNRDDVDGAWQLAIVDGANAVELGGYTHSADDPQIASFERVIDPFTALSSACRERCDLPNHTPHALNVPLVPRMMDVWLGPSMGAAHAPLVRGRTKLARGVVRPQEARACCCVRPPQHAVERAQLEKTAYWVTMCPLGRPVDDGETHAS